MSQHRSFADSFHYTSLGSISDLLDSIIPSNDGCMCKLYFNKVGDGIMVLVKACDLQMVWSSCSFHRTVMFYLHWCKSPLTSALSHQT